MNIESELKQKENKLQENRKIIEAQRKAIQELQVQSTFEIYILSILNNRIIFQDKLD